MALCLLLSGFVIGTAALWAPLRQPVPPTTLAGNGTIPKQKRASGLGEDREWRSGDAAPMAAFRQTAAFQDLRTRVFEAPDRFQLNEEQVEHHLAMRGRSLASLLTAVRLSGNLDYLSEAAERFPGNPEVLLEVAMRSKSPEERREALEAIRQADPQRSLADYLLALEQAKEGDREAAMRTFLEAGGKAFLSHSNQKQAGGIEQAFADNGFPPLEAKFLGFANIDIPESRSLLTLSYEMRALQEDLLGNGDTAAAIQLAQAAGTLNQRIQQEASYGNENLVGFDIEMALLESLPPAANLATGLTAGQRLADLKKESAQVQNTMNYDKMNGRDLLEFYDLAKTQGELQAFQQWNAQGR
ncbi:MAG: hypothetical protein WCG66_04620 [bacterium]